MRRGTFLTALALAPLSARALADDTVQYALTAAPLRFAPAPNVDFDGVAFNGRIPGPVLRVRRGQRIRVLYENHAPIATTVHWHGMILPNAMDGAAGITQAPVMQGGRFVYDF